MRLVSEFTLIDMTSIQDFVTQGGQSVTAGEVDAFRGHLAAYKLKAEMLEAAGQPVLREQSGLLLRYIEDVLDDAYLPEDFSALPEAVFAMRYLAKGVDIIPDTIPGIGYKDDAEVIHAVLLAHEKEFRTYCAAQHIRFDPPTV